MFTIIEDCSPYYIRFKYADSEKVIAMCNDLLHTYKFDHDRFLTVDDDTGAKVIEATGLSPYLDLMTQRVTMFYTKGGYKSPVHKDGSNHRISINFGVKILDSKCETAWYSDVIAPDYTPDYVDLTERNKFNGVKAAKVIDSREFQDFDEAIHKPIKRFTMKQGEVVLFNTDVWHRWNNRSDAERCILTLRVKKPGNFFFKDAKKVLFNL
jgi:hypothetical protein